MQHRPIHAIATDILKDIRNQGKQIPFGAKPYLEAMQSLEKPTDHYGCDDGKSIVLYGLSNLAHYRGENARKYKAELKAIIGLK